MKSSEFNGIIPIIKPRGISSYDVVRASKKKLNQKKIGHLGTLDPLAEGILVILAGSATRLNNLLHDDEKFYEFDIELGSQTTTLDAEGDVVFTAPIPEMSLDKIQQCICQFLGLTEQLAPIYSAIKFQGKPLYDYARSGREDEIPDEVLRREVQISKIDLVTFTQNKITLGVQCSKGTYVRSLARDIALRLGTRGFASRIARTQCGGISLGDCIPFDRLISKETLAEELVTPIHQIKSLPLFLIQNPEKKAKIMHGQRVLLPLDKSDIAKNPLNQATYVVLRDDEKALGIASIVRGENNLEIKLTRGL